MMRKIEQKWDTKILCSWSIDKSEVVICKAKHHRTVLSEKFVIKLDYINFSPI